MSADVETAIFDLLGAKIAPGKSISPEEVARAVDPEGWRRLLGQVRAIARGLARQGRVVVLRHNKLHLGLRPGTDTQKRRAIAEAWYRERVRQALPDLFAKWQPILGVEVTGFYVQWMRTRWGSCNPTARTIRLNTDLAKKPRECLEYIVVHELIHLLEPTHNARFVALMNRYMPRWQDHRKALNRLPVRHEDWDY